MTGRRSSRVRGGRRRALRLTAVFVLAAFLPLGALGCFGRFQLVRNVYEFNQDVARDQWTRWLVFLVLNLVPAYGLAAVLDAFLLNAIELWTGENPARAARLAPTRVIQAADGSRLTLALQQDRSIDVWFARPDGSTRYFRLAREGRAVTARAADGSVLARVGDFEGRPARVARVLADSR